MERALSRAAREGRPVLVGPWLSEIGFELLYWVPMLRRLLAVAGVSPAQVTAVSRGGPASWYSGIADSYVDVLDLISVDDLRSAQHERVSASGGQKQLGITDLDRRLWQLIAPSGALCVHPLVMYSRLRYHWAGDPRRANLRGRCEFARLRAPDVEPPPHLPARYVAAKPYFSSCFPDTPDNRRFVKRLLRALAERVDVVLLTTGLAMDDHAEPDALDHPRVHPVGPMAPRDNLARQTSVISRADAFVGTYGGPSYLGLFLDVPSTSFASLANFNQRHLDAADAAAAAIGTRRPMVVDTRSAGALERLLDTATAVSPTA